MAMSLNRTAKATQELAARERTLPLKDRAVLLLADGRKTATELATLVRCPPEDVQRLLDQGYLVSGASPTPRREPAAPPPPSSVAPLAVDRFDGPRSMATARLFLFDIVERLFARRAPALADGLRERLRAAREPDTMLAVARDLLDAVEQTAGFERADHIAERLARMLPEEGVALRRRQAQSI